jgi:hypothetical protein
MPYHAQWGKHVVQPALATLLPIMLCSAAAASPPGSPLVLAQFRTGDTGSRGYGDGGAGMPWQQRRPYSSGREGGSGYGGRPGQGLLTPGFGGPPGLFGFPSSASPSWPSGYGQPSASPPGEGGRQMPPPQQYYPTAPADTPSDASRQPVWQPPPHDTAQPGTVAERSGDGPPPRRHPPVTRRPPVRPHSIPVKPVTVAPPPQLASPVPPAAPPTVAKPAAPATPPPPPTAAAPSPPPSPAATTPSPPEPPAPVAVVPSLPPSQPGDHTDAPPPSPRLETVWPIGVAAAALAALALIFTTAWRRWRRNRQGRARLVLVKDAGAARMVAEDPAGSGPTIGLRLLSAAPVTSLRLTA